MPAPLAPSKWLSCPRPDPQAPLRLWCFPFAGGGAAAWHPWTARLAGTAEIVALRLPGRENRLGEKPITDVATLLDALTQEIAPYVREPYAFCGHSLGSMLAFEVARRLRARGLPPPLALIASGARAPDVPRLDPDLHHLPDAEFVDEVDRRYGGIPAAVRENPEFLDLFVPALRADLTIFETYVYRAEDPLALPVLALGGDRDPRVAREHVLAWQGHTRGPFSAEFFPGGHFFLQPELAAVTLRVGNFLRGQLSAVATM